MMIELNMGAFIAALGIPSAITGFCFWLIEQKIQKRDAAEKKEREARQKQTDEREAARENSELLILQQLAANTALCEATARAVQRIPDAHCNGDMDAALEYAKKIKHKQKDFLNSQAVHAIYD